MSLPFSYVEGLASSQTKEFLRPKTVFEKIQLILLLSWFLIAFLASVDLQAYLFFLIVLVFLLNSLFLNIYNKPRSTFLSTVLKFTFFFVIWLVLDNPSSSHSITMLSVTVEDILLVQKSTLTFLVIFGLFFKYIRLELLHPSSKNKIAENFLDFCFQIIKGISYGLFLYIFFDLIEWVPSIASKSDPVPNFQDILLLIASVLLLISSQAPEGKDLKKLFAQELFLISQTRFERLRDAILKVSIFILFFLKLLPIFNVNHQTLINEKPWTDLAVVLFVIGIITLVLSIFESRESKSSRFSNFSNNISNKAGDFMPEKLSSFKDSLRDVSINTDTQQFFKLTEDIPLVNKENTKFTAKKNSIAIPLKETPEGTAVIFVGESDVENINQKGVATKEKLEELATAMLLPNDVWNKTNLALEVIKPSDETISALALKGIESKEKLLSLAQNSLTEFRNMASSQMITKGLQGMVDNFRQGKYFVSDTAKGTFVRLPGITVIDNSETTFVRVFGIKVLESQGYTVVNVPFVKVIETPEYSLVNLPGINVVEAGKSNLVNLLGFQILDGDPKEIQAARQKIIAQSSQLDTAFNQLDNRVDNILANPDSFLLAQTSSGKKIELLTAANSSSALINSNLLPDPSTLRNIKSDIKLQKKSMAKTKVKPGKNINTGDLDGTDFNVDEPEDVIHTQIYEGRVLPVDEKLEKFYRIVKMSNSSIDLQRLANLLDFSSVDDLEKWLVDLNIRDLQINWEENKLIVNDSVIYGIKKVLKK